jgi:regulator of protease activity HflC (stomatin/prohibitin superfamily)
VNWAYILGILGITIILYLISSLRVLRRYERGVVFLLGKFEWVRGAGLTLIFAPIQQMAPDTVLCRAVAGPANP